MPTDGARDVLVPPWGLSGRSFCLATFLALAAIPGGPLRAAAVALTCPVSQPTVLVSDFSNNIVCDISSPNGSLTLEPSATLVNRVGGSLNNNTQLISRSTGGLTNIGGTISNQSRGVLINENGGRLANQNFFSNGDFSTANLVNQGGAQLINRGNGTVLDSDGYIVNRGIYVDPVTGRVTATSLQNVDGGALLNKIELRNEAGAVLTNSGGTIDPNTGLILSPSRLLVGQHATLYNDGSGTTLNNLFGASVEVRAEGMIRNTSGAAIINQGAGARISNASGSVLNVSGTLLNRDLGSIVNSGTLLNNAFMENKGPGTLLSNSGRGIIDNSGASAELYNRGGAVLQNTGGTPGSAPPFIFNQRAAVLTNEGYSFDPFSGLIKRSTLLNAQGGILSNAGADPGTGELFLSQIRNQSGAIVINDGSGTVLYNGIRSGVFGAQAMPGAVFVNRNVGTELINQAGALIVNTGAFIDPATGSQYPTRLEVTDGARLTNSSGAQLINSDGALLILGTTGTLVNESGAVITNSATIRNDGSITNSASFNLTGGGALTGAGTYVQLSGGQTSLSGNWSQALTDIRGGIFLGSGAVSGLVINGGTILGTAGGLVFSGDVSGTGAFQGVLDFQGKFEASGTLSGTMASSGGMTNSSELRNAGLLTMSGALSNKGKFTNSTDAELVVPGTVSNQGQIQNDGAIKVKPTGVVENTGVFNLGSTSKLINEGKIDNSGQMRISPGATVETSKGSSWNNSIGSAMKHFGTMIHGGSMTTDAGATVETSKGSSWTNGIGSAMKHFGTMIHGGSMTTDAGATVETSKGSSWTNGIGSAMKHFGTMIHGGSMSTDAGATVETSKGSSWNNSIGSAMKHFGTMIHGGSMTTDAGATVETSKGSVWHNMKDSVLEHAGTLTNAGMLKNDGTIKVRQTGVIENLGTFHQGADSKLVNEGKIGNSGEKFIDVGASVQNDKGAMLHNRPGGTIEHLGTLTNAGMLKNDGTIKVRQTGVIENLGTFHQGADSKLVNEGKIGNNGEKFIDVGASVQNDKGAMLHNRPGGTIEHSGTLTNAGMLKNDGTIKVRQTGVIENLGTFHQGADSKLVNEGKIGNSGEKFIDVGASVQNDKGAMLHNRPGGTIEHLGTLTNAGMLKNDGTIKVRQTGVIENLGTFHQGADSKLVNEGKIGNSGEKFIDVGASVQNDKGAMLHNRPGGTIEHLGTLTNAGMLKNDGTIKVRQTGVIENLGTFHQGADSKLVNEGKIGNSGEKFIDVGASVQNDKGAMLHNRPGGTIEHSGTLTNAGTLQNDGMVKVSHAGRVVNDGSLSVGATGAIEQKGSLLNTGMIANSGRISVMESGKAENHGMVANRAQFTVERGAQMTGTGSFVQGAGGSTRVDGTWEQGLTRIGASSSLIGSGRVAGPVQNQGVVKGEAAGITLTGDVSGRGGFAGTVRFAGVFSPGDSPALVTAEHVILEGSNTLLMELGGTERGAQYDAIDAVDFHLDGTLSLRLIDLGVGIFSLQAGDVFDLLIARAMHGDFSAFELPGLAEGLVWTHDLYSLGDDLTAYRLEVLNAAGGQVPEPATTPLILLALFAHALARRRRGSMLPPRWLGLARRGIADGQRRQ